MSGKGSARVIRLSAANGRNGSVAVEQSTERGGGFGQLCTPKRTGSSRPNSVTPDRIGGDTDSGYLLAALHLARAII